MIKQRIVVDASVMAKWLRAEKETSLKQADKLLKNLEKGTIEMYAPDLAKYEVGNVLVKRKLSADEAKTSLTAFYSLPISFIPETKSLAEKAYNFADELKITYYDGTYLSLTEEIGGVLITENIKHLGKTRKVKVIDLSKYDLKD